MRWRIDVLPIERRMAGPVAPLRSPPGGHGEPGPSSSPAEVGATLPLPDPQAE